MEDSENKDQHTQIVTHLRENYFKYEKVKKSLAVELETGNSAKEIAKSVGLSLPTFYKYKSLLCIENGKHYITKEEEKFISKRNMKQDIHDI